MALTFSPSVGQLLICDFGSYHAQKHPDGHISPEMVKRRLVVALNSKNGAGCVVVPLSTTYNENETSRGYHVDLGFDTIPSIVSFPQQQRWAKANMIEMVSRERLDRAMTFNGHKFVYLDNPTVELIQRAVIKVIGASLLVSQTPQI